MKPRTIVMDPPWEERGGGRRGAQNHFSLMQLGEIYKTIMRGKMPDGSPAFDPARNAHLWMWTTDNYMLDALALIDRLQFRYVRTMCWVKMHRSQAIHEEVDSFGATEIARLSLQMGLGQYLRGAHELCLFSTRGKAQVPATADRMPSVIFAPRTKHSRKPDESYRLIERVSPGPYREIFARRRFGEQWTVWGDEAPEGAA